MNSKEKSMLLDEYLSAAKQIDRAIETIIQRQKNSQDWAGYGNLERIKQHHFNNKLSLLLLVKKVMTNEVENEEV